MNWFVNGISKYAVFAGRARRKEYWMYTLFYSIFATAIAILCGILVAVTEQPALAFLTYLYSLALLLPTIAITVRRLHDTGRSGGWYFISFVPFAGGIILMVFLCQDGTPGNNPYGPDPKGRGGFTGNPYNVGRGNGSTINLSNDEYTLN